MKTEEDHNEELGSATDAAEVQAQATQPEPAEAEPEAETEHKDDDSGSGSATATVQIPQDYAGTTPDPEIAAAATNKTPQALDDDEVYESIKKQIAERGDAMVPEGSTAHQYLVQLIKWAQDVGKLDGKVSPETSRLEALEREVANLKAKLASHGMAIE